ncbi:hypothetical protein [Nocardioides marinquilinus]|uniref:hypothetical protein n=1 Tax=Nocardioides marinquilinus TaxID=1210400 RepID=UPI0031F1B788
MCYETATCTEDGEPGTFVDVYIDGEFSGKACLTPGIAENLAVITPGLVLREFERLTWPSSELQVQPVDQRTAVNWETFFFTDNTAPHTQTVTLLGQQVTIEATPSEYVYRFGEGASARTASPGGPYPRGDVTHVYRAKGSASPSVDTVYTGRYRVNGGQWIDIPAPLTVAGAPVTLQVIEIGPRLVTPPTD